MAKTTDRQRGRTWHTAYERIKELILSMEFKPGESVSESRLAQRLGISRTPVREALNKLEQEGLIISSNRRKRVFILTIAETEEIFDLKIAIESGVARWAARRAADPDRRRLAAAMEELTSIGGSRPGGNEEELEKWHRSWLEADAHFHAVLFEMA
jgi:DNA-binding GntR family transcriptional regulator